VVGRVKKTVVRVVAIDLIFLLLLLASGAVDGPLSELIYITAFIVPLLLFLWFKRGEPQTKLSFGIDGESTALLLPLIPLVIGITMGLSGIVSLLGSAVGIGGQDPLGGSIFELIILHALLPAVLEEALFRYVPLTLIAPHSKRSAVIISAILFAAAHCDLAQMPYAFAAGVIFAALDLASGSILPSVILHLVNNTVSVLWLSQTASSAFRLPFVVCLGVLVAVSAVLVLIFRGRYAEKASFLLNKGDRIGTAREVWVFFAVCIALAIAHCFEVKYG
jgi:membrane protease YdiL (CAAX protease family)